MLEAGRKRSLERLPANPEQWSGAVDARHSHADSRARGVSVARTLVLVGGLGGGVFVGAGSHGNDHVFALFAVRFRDTEDELVFVNAELGGFADGENRCLSSFGRM
jgi:hypothetical protein